jgi:hypothetical protein
MSLFDPQWDATWGENPIHYVRDEAILQDILQDGLMKSDPKMTVPIVYATPLRDFPPGGRVIIRDH